MNAHKELVRRLALKRRRSLGSMSDEAFKELELAVQADPASFVDDNEEQAFLLVARALDAHANSRKDDDLLDDEQYAKERERRNKALVKACQNALALDDDCVDAQTLQLLASDIPQNALFELFSDAHENLTKEQGEIAIPAAGDAWANVFARPRLRLQAALARTCINTTRFRMAADYCADLMARAPLDALGARYTCALAMARLEDEEGFNWLDAREGRHGNAWFHLSRVLLLYKLGRVSAARRALRGFDQLCMGGAYLLLQPMYVDTYLPDRPPFEPGSFEESMLCIYEADPVVSDTPDFAAWASDQPGFLASAQGFCSRNGFEWRDWNEGEHGPWYG